MPNHITNHLKVSGPNDRVAAFFEYIKGEPYDDGTARLIDFAKIIPSPAIYEELGEIHSGIETGAKIVAKAPLHPRKIIASLEADNRKKYDWSQRTPDDLRKIAQSVEAYQQYGFFYWYDWQIANWGTKWNAYSQETIDADTIKYETAWSSSERIIDVAVKAFPDLEITLTYADEDSGCNAGIITYANGDKQVNKPEKLSNEAYEIYLSVNPDCDYIKMIDGKYQYVDEEE